MTDRTLTVEQLIHEDGPVLLTATGELDHHTAPQLTRTLADAPLSPGAPLVIDLSGLTYCDSTGITVLVTTYHRARAAGSSLKLAGLSDSLTRVFQIVGLDQVLSLYPTTEAALAAARH
ncbi:anti-sigma factor antagonist [Streptomyces sp. WAC 01529]|uniref:STAS domain-containing protein n=1 Tax=Streptomyces sp. WAC 01529 TaxID=2203205 RepID=UPI000F6E0954|nr:STAS domain-containing protein [Streptomyces sp. WAC 01529]AZM56882.1 anti-sigma factor antagonist [Streptomyces sp. WAC 01529]